MSLLHLDEGNFKKEVLESELPVLVDFWAPWCGPCRMIAPVLEEVTREYQGRIKVGKVNIDENSGVASRYAVMSIPTIMFFNQGKVVDQVVGVLSKSDLKNRIEEAFR
ncbi:MAG: thioredoxin [Candidatus Omnitrophota bacterium]